ncbi:HNH endonuclease family protein [Pseudomonas phage vB_PaeM_PA5oct]|uniref:HNH endonuclease family protein n=1 Tax=Pseudomonas phage vB_PaeM_PA5oct TaxID=2163605 RepID=A0A4Y5JU65_9CAUD|nr:HNH endonuclease [Pseudomonas phage vB_PaeM_PA5oct]QCG76227.1 HNH endonuclease family protein [Pseudomonas phage vB_PaeM_PA5oct]
MDTLILDKDGNPLCMLPLSVVDWQTSIKLVSLGKVEILKNYDNWEVNSPSITMKVPSIVMSTEYIKWNHKTKFSRNNVYLRDNYQCQFCFRTFPVKQLTLDHVLPKRYGGKTNWTNICTACKVCNNKKGDNKNIIPIKMPHRPTYYELVSRRQQLPILIRDSDWKFYLPWDSNLIIITDKKCISEIESSPTHNYGEMLNG